MKPTLFALAAAALLGSGSASAAVNLIAIGKLNASGSDLSTETAAPLENGKPGNLLGGLGSGLGYAGCDTFVSAPDRGPNADVYNPLIDNTTSYIPRFQTLSLKLAPAAGGSPLPYTLTPSLTRTTLLHSALLPLTYASGGAPALNAIQHRQYFSGRSDNFNPTKNSGYPLDARFDPESIRVSNSGGTVFITDEYGPYIYAFDRLTGARIRAYTLPDNFYVPNLQPVGDAEISGNSVGRVANKGMEGLAISPDGSTLFGVMQSPLIQDGGTAGAYTRIVKIQLLTGKTTQIAYPLTNIGTAEAPKYPTISDIVAVNDHQFLVDERDGKGLGDDSKAVFKKVFLIDIAGAADISNHTGAAALAPKAVSKTLFVDLVEKFKAAGIGEREIPAKIEGLAFGPDIVRDGQKLHTLYIANDNDFLATITDSKHSNYDNPNQFFVFSFAQSDLPGFKPQQLLANLFCGRP